jgi:hypothetical protein
VSVTLVVVGWHDNLGREAKSAGVAMSEMKIEGKANKRFRIFRSDKDGRNSHGEALAEYDTEVEVIAYPRRLDWHYTIRENGKYVTQEELERRIWTCELCGQSVIKRPNSRPILPSGYFENCKLRDHLVGDECIARRDLARARTLLKEPK